MSLTLIQKSAFFPARFCLDNLVEIYSQFFCIATFAPISASSNLPKNLFEPTI
jgi:hypothetical protein